jgi:hypothetical protein
MGIAASVKSAVRPLSLEKYDETPARLGVLLAGAMDGVAVSVAMMILWKAARPI